MCIRDRLCDGILGDIDPNDYVNFCCNETLKNTEYLDTDSRKDRRTVSYTHLYNRPFDFRYKVGQVCRHDNIGKIERIYIQQVTHLSLIHTYIHRHASH